MSLIPSPLMAAYRRLWEGPMGARLARGTTWSVFGAVASRALGFLASVLIARRLGPEGFGALGILQGTIGMFGAFAGFGLGMTATKYVAALRMKDPERVGRILAMSGLVALVTGTLAMGAILAIAPWLAVHVLAAPHLAGLLRRGAGVLLLGALNGAQMGALSGFEAFKRIAWVNVVSGLINFPLMLGGVYLAGLEGAMWGLVAATAGTWALFHWAIRMECRRHRVPLHFKGCWRESRVLFSFSLPALLAGVMVGPVNWACTALIARQPNGYRELGVYNAANQWFTILLFLPGIFSQVVLPVLSEKVGSKDRSGFGATIYRSLCFTAAATIPAAVMVAVMSRFIMGLYGPEFSTGSVMLAVVVMTAALASIQNVVGQAIAASGAMWIGFVMNLGWATAFVGGTYYARAAGGLGIALARGVAYLVHSTWVSFYAYRFFKGMGWTREHSEHA